MAFVNRNTESKRKTIDIEIDGDTFRLQQINGLEKDEYEIEVVKRIVINGTAETEFERRLFRSKLIVRCLIDEVSGKRVYQDDEAEIFARKFVAPTIETVFRAAQKLNGMDAGAAEDAAKNSASAPAVASPSDLH